MPEAFVTPRAGGFLFEFSSHGHPRSGSTERPLDEGGMVGVGGEHASETTQTRVPKAPDQAPGCREPGRPLDPAARRRLRTDRGRPAAQRGVADKLPAALRR